MRSFGIVLAGNDTYWSSQVARLKKVENCSNVPLHILIHLLKSLVEHGTKWNSFRDKPLYASML